MQSSGSGGLYQDSSGYSLSVSTGSPSNFDIGPSDAGANTGSSYHIDFILFRVDATSGDTQEQGKIYFSYNWNILASDYHTYAYVEPLALTINGTPELLTTSYQVQGYSRSDSLSGSFDVSIGNIIGIQSFCEGGTDQQGPGYISYQFFAQSNATIELGDFNAVPLPPTVLLLGSGLLGLAGWRRFKKI